MDNSLSNLNLQQEKKKNYETWRGKSLFCCKGKIYIAPGYIYGVLTSIYIVLFSGNFSYYVAWRLENVKWSLLIIEIVFCFLTLLFCVLTTLTDPGSLPNQIYTPYEMNTVLTDRLFKYAYIRGYKLKMKFCKTCHIVRAPGIFHCRKCGACIERFDHHCPWVGNCIGRNNYKGFMAFIISFNSLLYYNTGVSVYYLIYKNSKRELENDKILNEEYMAFVHVLMAVITGLFLTTLLVYHIYFCCRNMTTYANIKMPEVYLIFGNPFSRKSCKKNCIQALCRKYYKKNNFFDYCSVLNTTVHNYAKTIPFTKPLPDNFKLSNRSFNCDYKYLNLNTNNHNEGSRSLNEEQSNTDKVESKVLILTDLNPPKNSPRITQVSRLLIKSK